VATHDFFRALLEQWDDLLSRLGDRDSERVHDVVADVVAGRLDPDDALVDLLRVLAPVLRRGDAILAALRTDRSVVLEAGPDRDVEAEFRRIVAGLADLVPHREVPHSESEALPPESDRPQEAPHSPEAVWRRARCRLLAVPHLPEPPRDGERQGNEPDNEQNDGPDNEPDGTADDGPDRTADDGPDRTADDGLIRLPRPDGSRQLPLFQFDDALWPHDLVVRVNRLLDAEDDPWGVADWWVSPHAVLVDPPATLLGTAREAEIWAAASALGGHRA
jgi:hypothetical protein